ncbi:hypothetical protein DFQ29_003425, partial [Apophysomyces sp. BC1021]
PSAHQRFVEVNAKTLGRLLDRPTQGNDFESNAKLFYKAFRFEKLGFKSLEDFLQEKNGQSLFINMIVSDGYSINDIFSRKKPAYYCAATLDLGDFTAAEIGHFFDPCACDPGLTNVYVAAYGGSTCRPHSVRQFTSSEYYLMLKTNKRSKKLDEKKKAAGINIVEQEMPSSKTTDLTKYNTYVGYFLGYLEALGNFYNLSTTQSRFQGYQLRQRAREEMANILIDGGL